jgi:hypothetical protein
MKRTKKLAISRETIATLTAGPLSRVRGGVEEERCRTFWWQGSCVPNVGASIAPEQTCSLCFAGCHTGDAC